MLCKEIREKIPKPSDFVDNMVAGTIYLAGTGARDETNTKRRLQSHGS